MKRTHLRSTVALLSFVAVFTLSAFAQGVVWESKITGNEKGEKESLVKTFYMPGKMRMEGDAENTVIIRLDQDKMYMVNMKEKTYRVMTFADMEKQLQGLDAKMAQLQEQMKNMPEEQRKMMEKMMEGKMSSNSKKMKIDVLRTAETKSINGYACTKYVMKRDGKEMSTIWATKDVKEFPAMKRDLEAYAKRFSSANMSVVRGVQDAMAKVDGFPILMTGEGAMTTTVTKIESRSTPDSAFEVPAGFKQVEMKGMKGEEKE